MRQLPPSRASSGYTPNRLKPLALAPVSDQGQRLTDIQAIQRMFANGESGGYWPADPAFLYEDSAGTTVAALNGVVGLRVNRITGQPNASQATTANKPYLRRTPVSGKDWLDSNTANGALTATFSGSLGSACTIAAVGAEGVTILEGQTVGTSYNITPAYGYNGDILIINRALTAVEKALVTRVLGRGVPTLGNELIVNGNFETDAIGWNKNNTGNLLSVENGRLRVACGDTNYASAWQWLGGAGEKTYIVKAVGYKETAPQASVSFGDTSNAVKFFNSVTTVGGFKRIMSITVVGQARFYLNIGANQIGLYAEFDNASIVEIL